MTMLPLLTLHTQQLLFKLDESWGVLAGFKSCEFFSVLISTMYCNKVCHLGQKTASVSKLKE